MNDELARKDGPFSDEWLRNAIDRHEHMLVRYAQQFVHDTDRARDVVQDTFMKLVDQDRKRHRTHERLTDKHLTKWLFRVCRNRAIDIARKEKRMKFAPSEQFDERLDSGAQAPDAAALAEERQETLLSHIATLTSNQQEVLRLKFHGGLSYQEIADVTGLTKTNVGFILHTAISKLRQTVT